MDYKSRARVYHNFAVMLEAGVSLRKAVATAAQGGRGAFGRAFAKLSDGLAAGNTIPQAMHEDEREFAAMDIMLAEAADETGETAECFRQLGEWYALRLKMKRIIMGGMAMPVLIMHAGALFAAISTFALGGWQVGPALVQFVTALAFFWVPAAAIVAIRKAASQDNILKRGIDTLAISVPLLKIPMKLLALSQYTRAFHTLYKAGVPITNCAQRSCELVGNTAAARWFAGAVESTRAGGQMSEGCSREVGEDFLNCWQVGEEAGELDTITGRLAKQYEERAELAFTEMARWLPRVVYCMVAMYLIIEILRGWSKIYGGQMEGF